MNTLIGIARRSAKQAPMETLEHASISRERGVAGDFRGKPGRRQVTVLGRSSWERACTEVKTSLPWTTRRANLFVDGLEFSPLLVGSHLRIGNVILEITRETDPCERMEAACSGLQAALAPDWRGGVCCRVLAGGDISLGDEVSLLTP